MSSKKQILVLGAGGHGLTSLDCLFQNQNINFRVYYNTTDWGGSYGLWGRLLEHKDNELNKQLHQKELPVLPFADPNKLILYYWKKINPHDGDMINFRSNNYKEQIKIINKITEKLDIDKETNLEILAYVDKIWKYWHINKSSIKYKSMFCIAYPIHSFIFHKLKSIDNWNTFWHKKNILPKNLNLLFTNGQRNILVGKDISLEEVSGENNVDIHKSPFLPETMYLQDIATSQESICSSRLIKDLQNADLVIIPNGSVANWIPIVNQKAVRDILQKKIVVWITNPYRTKNELINPNYYLFFRENGITPITLAQKNGIKNSEFLNILEQDKNGRYLSEQISTEILKWL